MCWLCVITPASVRPPLETSSKENTCVYCQAEEWVEGPQRRKRRVDEWSGVSEGWRVPEVHTRYFPSRHMTSATAAASHRALKHSRRLSWQGSSYDSVGLTSCLLRSNFLFNWQSFIFVFLDAVRAICLICSRILILVARKLEERRRQVSGGQIRNELKLVLARNFFNLASWGPVSVRFKVPVELLVLRSQHTNKQSSTCLTCRSSSGFATKSF